MTRTGEQSTSVETGSDAEDIACAYLQQRGLALLARNYRCRRGEIDLVMRDQEYLVFVEVRFRTRGAFGSAAETVSAAKRSRIITTASYFLQRRRTQPPCRFDVLAITGRGPERIDWIRDAFQM